MHFLVDRNPKTGYTTRCGIVSKVKRPDISVWGSDITCEVCRG